MDNISISVTDNKLHKGEPWSLEHDSDGALSLADFREFIRLGKIEIAKRVLAEEQAMGFDKKPRVRVGGKWGAPLESGRAFGAIEYYSRENIAEILIAAYKIIMKRSPMTTTHYMQSHYVFLNNKIIATSLGQLRNWLKHNSSQLVDNSFVRIVNVMPYAARLEISGISKQHRGKSKGQTRQAAKKGKSKYTGNMIKKPNGVYVLAARAIRSRYKGAASFVKFAFMPNGTGGINVLASSKFRSSYIPGNKRYSGAYVYPSIVFGVSGAGTK